MRTFLLAAALAAATPLSAQVTQQHKGFWFGFGFGVGENTSTQLDGGQLVGGAGYIRLGGSPSQKVLLGFDGMAWTNEDRNRGNGVFSVTFYPQSQGFYIKGGLGFASLGATETNGGVTQHTTVSGFGLTGGIGYDIRLGRNIYLVPAVDILGQFFKEQTAPVLGNIPKSNALFIGTVGLLWH